MIQDSIFDFGLLNDALRDAIRKPDRLTYFLRSQFGKRLTEIVSLEKDYIAVVAAVVDSAEAEGWVDDLVRAALQEVPGNVKLRSFAQQVDPHRCDPSLFDAPGSFLTRTVCLKTHSKRVTATGHKNIAWKRVCKIPTLFKIRLAFSALGKRGCNNRR